MDELLDTFWGYIKHLALEFKEKGGEQARQERIHRILLHDGVLLF